MSSAKKSKFRSRFFETMSIDDAVKILEAHWRLEPGTLDASDFKMHMVPSAKVVASKKKGESVKFFCYNVFYPRLRGGNLSLVISKKVMNSDRVLAITHSLDGG